MKKMIVVIAAAIVAYAAYIIISLALMPPVSELADKKINMNIQVKDWQGDYHPFVVGPKNRYWTPSGRIPAEMKEARPNRFEDGRVRPDLRVTVDAGLGRRNTRERRLLH
jgi:hypothetical protein